jgi:hypothetical protein
MTTISMSPIYIILCRVYGWLHKSSKKQDLAAYTVNHRMNLQAHSILMLGLVSGMSLRLAAGDQPPADFRQAHWGMTKAQVLAAEPGRPSEVRESNGEMVVRYDSVKLPGLDASFVASAVYIFAKDRLVRAKYLLPAEHENLNDFITDYHVVEPVLKSAYGEPTSQEAVWLDDSTQEERKGYLDQDRALPENIFASDRNVGLAVSLGHLKLYTQWNDDRTKITHALTGVDGVVTHQIEYRGAESSEPSTDRALP